MAATNPSIPKSAEEGGSSTPQGLAPPKLVPALKRMIEEVEVVRGLAAIADSHNEDDRVTSDCWMDCAALIEKGIASAHENWQKADWFEVVSEKRNSAQHRLCGQVDDYSYACLALASVLKSDVRIEDVDYGSLFDEMELLVAGLKETLREFDTAAYRFLEEDQGAAAREGL